VTTLSVNLALAFAVSLQVEMPLIELHPAQDNVLIALGLGSESLRGNLRATGSELNWDTLVLHLVEHPKGVRVLPAPPPGSDVPSVLTRRAMSLLLSRYPLVLVDAASELDARVQSALLAADLILLVMTPEATVIRSALQAIQDLRALEFPERQILLVMNNVQPQPDIPVAQIAKGIKRPIFSVIPYEPGMRDTIRTGRPLLLTQPGAPASRAIARISTQLAQGFKLPTGVR
jgi:pilus assembly protein CpaE